MRYAIDLTAPPKALTRGHLDLGGTGPAGAITVNSYYIEHDGKPFFPIVGEFHYARYPAADWDDELRKMKAGGINVVATYVFWNLHERREGQFDWAGDLDLRRFIGLAKKAGLRAIVRVGPFAHGEIRNGGLPDWLYGRSFDVRSNDPGYLAYCEKFYAAIAGQVTGLLFKDGGPIIGVQLENEFQHSAAPWEIRYAGSPRDLTVADRDAAVTHVQISTTVTENKHADYGRDHMANLKLIAKRQGLDAPLYTATGWGNAAIVPNGSLPVSAAYAYPYWVKDASPSPFYSFTDLQMSPDYPPTSYDARRYPVLAAELGTGMNQVYARRSYIPEESVEPMMVRMLGSGANGLGYYMYHGGATPAFDGFYNEDASGLPKINYDYQAPIGQYGQVRGHYRGLRVLHLFLSSFGDRLAPCATILPANHAETAAEKTGVLRYAARGADGAGFVFLLNYQDHAETIDLPDIRLEVADGPRTIAVPSSGTFTLKQDVAAILPINFDVGGINLRSATVQPLSRLTCDGRHYFVFFSIDGLAPELVFDSGNVADTENCHAVADGVATVVTGPADHCFSFTIGGTPVLVVPRRLALDATPIAGGRLVFADATVFESEDGLTVLSAGKTLVDLGVYPACRTTPGVAGAAVRATTPAIPTISQFQISFEPVTFAATLRKISARRYAATFDAELGGLNEVFLRVNFVGDTGMAFIDGRLVDDFFYSGKPWEIGLKRFLPLLANKEMVFVFQPIERGAACLKDIPAAFQPAFPDGVNHLLSVAGLDCVPEYKATLVIQ